MNINLEGCRGVTSVYKYNPGLPRLVVLLKTVHLGLQSMCGSNPALVLCRSTFAHSAPYQSAGPADIPQTQLCGPFMTSLHALSKGCF